MRAAGLGPPAPVPGASTLSLLGPAAAIVAGAANTGAAASGARPAQPDITGATSVMGVWTLGLGLLGESEFWMMKRNTHAKIWQQVMFAAHFFASSLVISYIFFVRWLLIIYLLIGSMITDDDSNHCLFVVAAMTVI